MSETDVPTLRDFLASRNFPQAAVALLTDLDESTISRIVNGESRPLRITIVRLAIGLGVGMRRMKAICDVTWDAAHSQDKAAVR